MTAIMKDGRTRGALMLVALVVATAACGGSMRRDVEELPDGVLPGGKVITRQDIARIGAHDAWEAIVRSNTHLMIARGRAGDPSRITYRGVDSLVRERDVLVVVDGGAVRSPEEELKAIKAESILFIQVLSGREAALRWGSEAANGVILVQTTAR